MKKILVPILLMIFLINAAYGFPGMAKNSSAQPNTTSQPDLNTTESDLDIVLVQHLIEVDAVQLQEVNQLFIRETLIFKNTGAKNFVGFLRTWVQDGARDIKLGKSEMTTGGFEPISFNQKGNIVSWQDFVEQNSRLPFLYVIEYTVLHEPKSSVQKYSKMLAYPTLINYMYADRPGLPGIVLKITKPGNSKVTIVDENKNTLHPSEVSEEDNSVIDRFYSPQFKELNIEISESAMPAEIAVYVILGLIIILVLSYPLIRNKSEKLRAIEENIRNSLKRKEAKAGEREESIEKTTSETEFEGKTKDELENLKDEILSGLSKLDNEYASGNLLDEEYEELRSSCQEKLEKISTKIEQLND